MNILLIIISIWCGLLTIGGLILVYLIRKLCEASTDAFNNITDCFEEVARRTK